MPAWPTDPDAPLPEAVVAELAWGFQDSVVDVLTTKTIRAAREVGARSIVLGGGVAANGALRARLAGRGGGPRRAAHRAATRPVHGQRGDDRGGRAPAGSPPANGPAWTSTRDRHCPLAIR